MESVCFSARPFDFNYYLCHWTSSKASFVEMYRIAPYIEKLLQQRALTDRRLARHEQLTRIAVAGIMIVSAVLLGVVISHIVVVPSHPRAWYGFVAAQ